MCCPHMQLLTPPHNIRTHPSPSVRTGCLCCTWQSVSGARRARSVAACSRHREPLPKSMRERPLSPIEPPAATVIEDAPPCEPETLACTADSDCARFMHETLKGANMEDCEANAECKAMIDCAMGLATGGLPPPPPPRRQKEPPGNNPCGVPVRSNTLCVCSALSR